MNASGADRTDDEGRLMPEDTLEAISDGLRLLQAVDILLPGSVHEAGMCALDASGL